MIRDPAEAEELTQDTYTRALERSAQLRDPQAALAWLYRIATTVTLDRLRQRRPVAAILDEEEAAAAAERQRPPSMHDSHGFSNREIAEPLGCSFATAKIRVHRARNRLREALAAACSFEIDERGMLVCDPQPADGAPDSDAFSGNSARASEGGA